MNGVINLGISEQASESSDESQIDVIKGDDGNIGMLMGQSSLPSPSPSENNNNGDIYGEVRESEKFREMLIEEIEKSSSEEDKESEEKSEAKSSVNEKACIFTVRERKTQGQVNIPEQSETEESGSSREDEQSVNDSQGTGMVIMDAVIHGDNKEEQGNTEDDGKCYLNKKKEDQTKCNTKKSITSEDEMSEKANISDEETLSSEDLDASDQMDSSEEEENTDFWGSGHEDIDEIEKDVELQSSSSEDSTKQVNVSAREEDPPEPAPSALDVVAASCQDVIEDEEVNSEKQRSSWLCCLKTCSLPNILNKSSEDQRQGKRCSEDASMDMLQMHPVEFGTSLPAEEVSAGPITNVNTEDASAADTNAEDSGEESIHSKKESENHNEQWSDSEDNVHSFYD
ncbi:uncharacterized protein [Pyxicephalus adspersus]|uniref:uncharacterized protein n=1 Tax=Pyxicephalus adspersus TaxID=30357 RepID=UPI003B59B998